MPNYRITRLCPLFKRIYTLLIPLIYRLTLTNQNSGSALVTLFLPVNASHTFVLLVKHDSPGIHTCLQHASKINHINSKVV